MEGFLNPSEVLKQLRLKKDMTAADFGSGPGGWTIPLAKILEDGLVYAIDILKAPLSVLEGTARLQNIRNIKTIISNVEKNYGSTLPDSSVDLVLMSNLLFQSEKQKEIFAEAKRILKIGGKVLVIDWKEDSPVGPAQGRVSLNEVKEMAKMVGLKLEKEFEAGIYHFGLVFVKT